MMDFWITGGEDAKLVGCDVKKRQRTAALQDAGARFNAPFLSLAAWRSRLRKGISVDELEFGEHGDGPEQIFDTGGLHRFANDILGEIEFGRSRFSTERSFVEGWDERFFGHGRIIEQIVGAAF